MQFPAKITSSNIWVAIPQLIDLFYIGMPVVRTDSRSVRRTITWLPKFLGWVDYYIFLLMHGASAARASRARAPLLTLLLPVIRSLVTSLENIQHIVQSEMVRMGTLISLRTLYNTVADPGERLTLPSPSLFSDQTEARRAKKNFGDRPPYIRVWILHCNNPKFFYFINVQ